MHKSSGTACRRRLRQPWCMKPVPEKYRTTNWKVYNAALKARGGLLIWLDPTMNWHGEASGKPGGSPTSGDQAIQFTFAPDHGMAESLLHMARLDWPVPDYSTLSRRQRTLQLSVEVAPTTNEILERRAGPDGQYGRGGAAITDVDLSKPRCAVSNCSANGSWRVASIVKSLNCKCALPCSTASRALARQLRSLCHYCVDRKQTRLFLICATEPQQR